MTKNFKLAAPAAVLLAAGLSLGAWAQTAAAADNYGTTSTTSGSSSNAMGDMNPNANARGAATTSDSATAGSAASRSSTSGSAAYGATDTTDMSGTMRQGPAYSGSTEVTTTTTRPSTANDISQAGAEQSPSMPGMMKSPSTGPKTDGPTVQPRPYDNGMTPKAKIDREANKKHRTKHSRKYKHEDGSARTESTPRDHMAGDKFTPGEMKSPATGPKTDGPTVRGSSTPPGSSSAMPASSMDKPRNDPSFTPGQMKSPNTGPKTDGPTVRPGPGGTGGMDPSTTPTR